MNQPYSRIPTNPVRYSSRKPIFEEGGSNMLTGDNDEFYRIVAKIRSLEDDVKIMIDENKQIQTDNIYLKRLIGEFQYTSTFQEDQIIRLNEEMPKQNLENDPISKYEDELKLLSRKVEHLHEQINQKHQFYQHLKVEKRQLQLNILKAKEESSQFQFQENGLIQRIDQIIINCFDKRDFEKGSAQENVIRIIEKCKDLEGQICIKNQQLASFKKKAEKQYTQERQRRIQEEYKLQLLRQRNQDYDKKKDFFKSCYNEQNIQNIINEMLSKQHELRQQINYQNERNQDFKQEREEAIYSCDKRLSRERAQLLQELKIQRVQNEVVASQRARALNDLNEIEQSLMEIEEEGAQITLQNKVADGQNFKKISQLQAQNVMLQRQYAQLLQNLNMLRQDL